MQIFIKNLTFETIIGILELERKIPQKISVDIKIRYTYEKEVFINYAQVADFVISAIKKGEFFLLEEALEFTIQKLKMKFPQIETIKMKISKPNILKNCIVGAKIKKNFKKN